MKELYKALATVQSNLKAPKANRNTFGNYNYRSAEDILEAVKPLLKENGLTMILSDKIIHEQSQHKPEQITYKNSKGYDVQDIIGGDRFYIESKVTVFAEDGTFVEATGVARESQYKAGMDDSQITGAASSYARKYALNGMFNIDDTKDSDSNEYHNQQANAPKQLRNRQEEAAAGPETMGESLSILDQARLDIGEELKRQGYNRPDTMLSFIKGVIGKEKIETIDDATLVANALDDNTEE